MNLIKRFATLTAVLVFSLALPKLFGQSGMPAVSDNPAQSPTDVVERHYHLEGSAFENAVSNGFGNWWGGGLSLAWQPSARAMIAGNILSQRRPGETEQLAGLRTLVNWSKWFYTDMTFSGGGPDDPTAFFPKFRYDLTANAKLPILPGVILTGGISRLYFGVPNNLRIAHAGAIYYWRRFVFQGNLNFNNSRPGERKSTSADGAVQYGQEGRYWMGMSGGGGTAAWQTLTFLPQNVNLTSYTASVFLRKWLAPQYGVDFSYRYTLLRTAYRINGLEMKFFLDF